MTIIESLEAERDKAELAALAAQRIVDACNVAIAAFKGATSAEWPVTKVHVPPAPVLSVAVGPVLNRDEERVANIKAALKAGPQTTLEISRAIGVDRTIAKQALRRLRNSGDIESIGHARTSKWQLPAPG